MNQNRRDRLNRRLRYGESQREDGRYRFVYRDSLGKRREIYSWRLDENDPMPEGRRPDRSLREKEKQIERDRYDQILSNGGNYTVLALVSKYVSLKIGVRHSTKSGYKTVLNLLEKTLSGKDALTPSSCRTQRLG